MNTKNLLLENREEFLKFALKSVNKTEQDVRQDVNILKEWLKTQKHLPEIPSDNIIINFLFINKFSVEIAKKRIDMYYTIRQLIPEFFQNKNPKLPHMQYIFENTNVFPFPKTTPEGYRVFYFGVKPDVGDKFDVNDFMGQIYNMGEIRMNEDVALGDIVIYDMSHMRMSHMTQMTPSFVKKTILVMEKVFNNRVKQIHHVNVPSFAEGLITLVKSFIKEKIAKRIFLHKDVSTLYDYLPKNILPKDLGGEEISFDELRALWKEKFAEYQQRFDAFDKMKVNEKIRPTPLHNDEVLGFYGNFKKLDVD